MSQAIVIPDDLYARLDAAAHRRGVSIEELLRSWQATGEHVDEGVELRRRHEAFERIAALGEELSARYGEMPDSTDLIREDRAR